jgi:hypothetical protein
MKLFLKEDYLNPADIDNIKDIYVNDKSVYINFIDHRDTYEIHCKSYSAADHRRIKILKAMAKSGHIVFA